MTKIAKTESFSKSQWSSKVADPDPITMGTVLQNIGITPVATKKGF